MSNGHPIRDTYDRITSSSNRQCQMESAEFAEMRTAIRRNNTTRLRCLAKRGRVSDLALLGKALLLAAECGRDECVQILLECGASPDTHTSRGGTPLIYAAKCGFAKVVRTLIDANCSVSRGMYGVRSTALHWAASMGNTDCVEALLEHRGIDPDAQTMHGLTALMFAVRRGEQEMAKVLVDAGANTWTQDHYGQCTLHHASIGGHAECAQFLLQKGMDIDKVDKKGNTALMLSVKENNVDMLRHLIEWGANVNVRAGKAKVTALHWASFFGHVDCLELLLDGGAQIDTTVQALVSRGDMVFHEGASALHLAAQRGHAAAIKSLIREGANLEIWDSQKMTALHYAAKHDNPECLLLLLKTGVGPDLQLCKFYPTPLSLAIRSKSPQCIKYLIRANCSTERRVYRELVLSRNLETLTPFQLAVECDFSDAIRMLALAGCNLSDLNIWVETASFPLELQLNQDLLQWLLDSMNKPKSLKEQSRKIIRRIMGTNSITRLNELPLPVYLKAFLSFAELESCYVH